MIDIPNYEIGKLAGRGGVAEVYLARHKLLDRKVAIKLISPTHSGDLADKRFLKEAKVVAGLRHSNIVSIYDVGVYENKYYIIMEYLEGGDLKQNIQRTLPVSQALKIMRQIASALAHAHDKGFIHRDIKSQNIMFRGDGTAVLTDFGIVKDLAADTGYTMDGTSIGTPHYMSPEQAQGMGGIDWRTDLYSLGVTFYEMLTGSLPYTADSPIAVALKHIKDPVPELPEQFVRFQPIISRLMAKNPDDRYQSAHDLILAIDKLEKLDRPDNLDIEDAAPTYPFLLPQKFGRKVNLANVFLGVVIGCIVFGLGLFLQPYLADRLHREQAPVEKSQTQAGLPEKPDVQAKKPSLSEDQRLKKLDYLKQAENSLAESRFTEAMEWIKKARAMDPDDKDLQISEWLITGDMHAAQGNFKTPENENALQYYQKIMAAAPQNKEAAMRIAAMDVMISLYQVRQKKPISEKIPEYQTLFSNLKSFTAEHGAEGAADLKGELMAQVKEDIAAQKSRNKTIPAEFLALVSDQFPDEKDIFSAQYDILIAKGDESGSKQEKADYYLQALKLDPSAADAPRKIEKTAKSLDEGGNTDAAQEILKQARDIAPSQKIFKDMLQDIKQRADVKAELAAQLLKIQQNQNIIEKTRVYATLLKALNTAAKRHGSKKTADLERDVKSQAKADIQNCKTSGQLIPDEFITLLKKYSPELHKSAVNAQYDILIGKGDKGASNQDAANYYLKAMNLDKNRGEAKNRIELLIKDMENNGDASGAADLVNKAMQILPNELIFAELSGKMKSHIEVFATASGCGKANRITQAPVGIENITICIYYKNMAPDSVVNIVLQQKGGKKMEAPLILDGRSGNKAVDIMAPIEGFVVGEYTISVRQGGNILSETTIQLTPKRR
jgi:serine/threonine protein kinase